MKPGGTKGSQALEAQDTAAGVEWPQEGEPGVLEQ